MEPQLTENEFRPAPQREHPPDRMFAGRRGSATRESGFALVMVLIFLTLMVGLSIAFFTSVTTDSSASASASNEAATKQLADSTVQNVIGQIKQATSGANAWASQPGMVRTYGPTGAAATNYKLYSSGTMTTSGELSAAQVGDYAAAWTSNKALWTDMNAPVADAGGTLNYPVLDPAATTRGVQGFSITNPPGYSSGNAVSAANNPAPMPVQWLYQLRDGTLAAATAAGADTVTVAGASSTNSIVGRVAFWTDDETCKVNINTAGEGTFWDTPRFVAPTTGSGGIPWDLDHAWMFADYGYAAYQPAQYEFQRYPGHPAQVALSTIFPGITSEYAAGVTPRLAWGGSQGGSTWAGGASAAIDLSTAPRKPLYATVDELLFQENRTVNAFSPTGSALTKAELEAAKFFITATSRAPEVNLFNLPRIACWPIDKELATNPLSPRTTAYDRLIAFCSTQRRDLGQKAYRYYFQRSDSQSATKDYDGIERNQQLYAYLQRLTGSPVPGFGGNFLSKYGTDRDQILTEIFDYIRCTNLSDPNLAGTLPAGNKAWSKGTKPFFANYQHGYKPGGDLMCGQVMPIKIGATMGFGRYHTIKDLSMIITCTGDGRDGPMPASGNATIYQQSNDIASNLTLAGTSLASNEKRFQIFLLPNLFLPSPGMIYGTPELLYRISGLDQIQISGATNIDGGSLFPSAPTASGWVGRLTPTSLGGSSVHSTAPVVPLGYPFAIHRSPLYFRSTMGLSSNEIIYPFISRAFTLPAGATITLANAATLTIEIFQAKGAYDSNDSSLSPLYKMPGAPTYDQITSDSSNLIQTINLTFPAGTFAQPTLPDTPNKKSLFDDSYQDIATSTSVTANFPLGAWGFDARVGYVTGRPQIIAHSSRTKPFDTVRTVSVKTGDVRAVAASQTVPAGMFDVDSIAYSDSTPAYQSFHYLTAGPSTSPPGIPRVQYRNPDRAGKLVPGITDKDAGPVDLPQATTIYSLYGDFDGPQPVFGQSSTAWPSVLCGPWINKPDEGDSDEPGTINNGSNLPYYCNTVSSVKTPQVYTPNRIMPSPGMFGSLPTGVRKQIASNGVQGSWQTLLFRPQPTHPNYSSSIPDHLIMDLFWMPVVEPYAISEPFSTAGKINMNYQIAPFTYITRATAMMSAMKAEKISARPLNTGSVPNTMKVRLDINTSETGGTLQQFKEKFATGKIFKSATEICDQDLVPIADPAGVPQTWTSSWASKFWAANANTGDNTRERPYANLYPRLTTKSNTFTVHYRVQTLKKSPGGTPNLWDEGRDQIVGESRGSAIIERYVDVNDPRIPDFATDTSARLDTYYKFRVINSKRFAP